MKSTKLHECIVEERPLPFEEEGRVLEKKADRVSIFNLSIGGWWKSGRELIAGLFLNK